MRRGAYLAGVLCLLAAQAAAPPAAQADEAGLYAQPQVFVRRFVLEGNRVIPTAELEAVVAPWQGRTLRAEELEAVRQALSRHYVERGYLNSGALLPDQAVHEGVVRLRIVEGRLGDIRIEGTEALAADYVRERLARAAGEPLHLPSLQQGLLLLQDDPAIARIEAELAPGAAPGDAVLRARVEEQPRAWAGLRYANDQSPQIGPNRAEAELGLRNLAGRGDTLQLRHDLGDDGNAALGYALPLNARDTALSLYAERSDADIVEAPFNELDIDSRTRLAGIGIDHPVYRVPGRRLDLGLGFEHSKAETFLAGEPFSFSPGVEDGHSVVSALRLRQQWLERSPETVLALYSRFSVGLPLLGATRHDHAPDSRFFSWLGQGQWVQRVPGDGQLLLRGGAQLAAQGLLPQEKFALGGQATVRGYRENLLVRDNGAFVSLEGRWPIPGSEGLGRLELAPFTDWGQSWDKDDERQTLASVGLGLRWQPVPGSLLQIYKGFALRDVGQPDTDLQDRGVHFLVSFVWPEPR